MRPEVPAILGVLRHAIISGRSQLLTKSDVEALDEVVAERAALLEAAQAVMDCREDGTFGPDGVQGFEMLSAAIKKASGQ